MIIVTKKNKADKGNIEGVTVMKSLWGGDTETVTLVRGGRLLWLPYGKVSPKMMTSSMVQEQEWVGWFKVWVEG